jgi:hypothetical protein
VTNNQIQHMKLRLFPFLILVSFGMPGVMRAEEGALTVGEFTFKAVAPWKVSATPKPMSQGGFTLPGKDGTADLDAAFYHFGPSQGGDLEGNVKRWQGMFTAEPAAKTAREEIPFGAKKATLVTITGTYKGSSFSPVPPKADQMLIAAVLPSDKGDVFVRMVGPVKEVTATREDFKKLLSSAVKK